MVRLHGIVPPVVTPLAGGERVDADGLRRLLERLVAGGVHGIYFLGSTGEQPALRGEERGRAIELAMEQIGGRVPLVVGTMAPSTAHAIDNIEQAVRSGADAVAVTPAYYYPTRGPAEQLAHFRACAAAADVPVLIYNIPQTTKVMLSAETIAEIAALPNVAGIKDSSGDLTHFLKVVNGRPDPARFACLIGSATLIGPSVLFGGDGAVPGIANVDPALAVGVYEAARRGSLEEARALQARLTSLYRIVELGAPIACLKTALELMGICRATTCAPLQPVTGEVRERIAAILREHELVE